MFAAVDLGSNSFRLHVGRVENGVVDVVRSAREPVRLGGGLDETNHITPGAMQLALAALRSFSGVLREYSLEAVRAVGTQALRQAANAPEFVQRAEQALGYPVEIISGEEEGRLIYLGVASNSPSEYERRLVIDVGGGSTEIVLGHGRVVERVESFSIGTVRKNLKFFPEGRIDGACFESAVLSARSIVEDGAPVFRSGKWSRAYGSSGTVRAVAEAIAKNGIGDGTFTFANLEHLRDRLIEFGHVQKIELAGLKPDRANVICGGVAILLGLMEELEIEALVPVQAGVRMGLLWDMHLRSLRGDRRDAAVADFARRFHVDAARGAVVRTAARQMYSLSELSESSDSADLAFRFRLLDWAAELHECGQAVSHTGFHKHGAYLLENADLAGFSGRDQKRLAQLVLAQKGNLRKVAELLTTEQSARAVLCLRVAVALLHAQEVGAAEGIRISSKGGIHMIVPGALMQRHPTLSWWLSREKTEWEEVGIPFNLKVE